MPERTDTVDAPVSKFNAVDSGARDGGSEDGLHREIHSLTPVGGNSSDNLSRGQGQSQGLETLPPLSIEGLEPKADGKADSTDAGESPLESFTLEKQTLGQTSIRGQNRYLETEAIKLTTVNMDGDAKGKGETAGDGKGDGHEAGETATEGVPPPGPVPHDLKEVVGEEREAEFAKAFELMDRFDQSVNQDVLKPGITKLSDMLDQAERDMPPEKLDALEAERKKYGAELKDWQESQEVPDADSPPTMSNLLYRLPPERGKEMKEFDRKVQDITAVVGKEMAENMTAVGAKFNEDGGALTSADELVQEYYQRKEDLAPHHEPLPEPIEA